MIADSKTEHAAKALTMETARQRDAGRALPPGRGRRVLRHPRWLGAWLTGRCRSSARRRTTSPTGIERLYRDRIFRIYEGTSQIQQVVIARETLVPGRLMSAEIEATIFDLLGKVAPGKSISPEEVARAAGLRSWRRLLGHVRAVARGLARQDRLVILRHNKPADPSFKGVYRLRLPDAGPLKGDQP